jgi:hypothetical protein
MGQIAGDAALAAFILAGLMLSLVGFGLLHYRRVSVTEELGTKSTEHETPKPELVTV